MNSKDFYIDTHFLCGFRSLENIFDLPYTLFECDGFLKYEAAVKKLAQENSIKMHLWPWQWDTSKLTDEVYIYEMKSDRLLYYRQDMGEFYDGQLVRVEQFLEGCEVFDIKFQFPRMLNLY